MSAIKLSKFISHGIASSLQINVCKQLLSESESDNNNMFRKLQLFHKHHFEQT